MILPFKSRVLNALTAALKGIHPDAELDYYTDMRDFDGDRSRVFRGRAWFGESDPLPMISILEGVSPADEVAEPPVDTTTGEFDWPLTIQGFVDDDPLNPTDPAYLLLADVRQCLAAERVRKVPGGRMPDPLGLGIDGKNRITSITIGPGVVRPADDVSSKAYFWLSLVVRVVDNAAAPRG